MANEPKDTQRQRPPNGLDPDIQKQIGRMLKAAYDQVAREPVPDKFLSLLQQLEAAEPRKR